MECVCWLQMSFSHTEGANITDAPTSRHIYNLCLNVFSDRLLLCKAGGRQYCQLSTVVSLNVLNYFPVLMCTDGGHSWSYVVIRILSVCLL